MKHNELLKELEKRMSRYGYCDTWTHIELFIKEYEALTKDEKPIRLKDVIKRIKGFDDETKLKWTYDILKELGSDFASKIFHEAYQQGRFDEALETHHEPQKVVVPKYVADWIEESKQSCKNVVEFFKYKYKNIEMIKWIESEKRYDLIARAWLDGYEVEKEPKYIVKLKGVYHGDLGYAENFNGYSFYNKDRNPSGIKYEHTRKQLEEAGFGWVFDCEGIEIEEVTE